MSTTTDVAGPQETPGDALASLPPEKLVAMLREKRAAEASVRARLREAETERDALAGKITAWQTDALRDAALAAGVAESALPDLERALGDIGQYAAADGTLDTEKVTEALGELRESSAHYFVPGPRPTPRSGPYSAGRTGELSSQPTGVTWADVLTG